MCLFPRNPGLYWQRLVSKPENSTTQPKALTLTLESRVEVVDSAEEVIRVYAQALGFPEQELYFIGLAVREVLVNAMKHGNGFDPEKKVKVKLSGSDDEFSIDVADEGQGFHPAELPDPRDDRNLYRLSGRGVLMAMSIMDGFYVERTSAGSEVRMTRRRGTPVPGGL